MTRIIAIGSLVTALGWCSVFAQAPKPTFEVASVRMRPGPLQLPYSGPVALPGGIFDADQATVETLIMFAFDLKPFQIVGAPAWVRSERYAVGGRAGFDAPAAQVRLMVQSLLEDRFGLVARKEQRRMTVLALVLARADGRLGPFILQAPEGCTPATSAALRQQLRPRAAQAGERAIRGQCNPLSVLTDFLAINSEMPVVDKTGLAGKFVWEARAGSVRPGGAGGIDPNLPPLNVALEEQLGLKLEEQRLPVDVLVIDSVHTPTEN
jgi:uncharacterized protein (TIGR03435 family)